MRRGLALACVLIPAVAWADLIAPKMQESFVVVYPEGAHGDAHVLLDVRIDPLGKVVQAVAVEGTEPFVSAAIVKVSSLIFAPATKDGVPIAARIRLRITFHEPVVPTGSASTGLASSVPVAPSVVPSLIRPPTTAPSSVAKRPNVEAIDITVEGSRSEIGVTSLGGGDIRILPGAFGDPFRAIEALPGVTPFISGVPFFFIRGAPPGNAGYYIDGVRVPLLFHLGAGPSIVAPGLIDHVDFYPGGYPARFGRVAGGVIAGATIEPGARLRAEGNVRLFDASALVETPVSGGRGDLLVAGRFGYPGLIFSLVQSETGLQYWDYQIRAGYRTNEHDRISVFLFGAFDELIDRKKNFVAYGSQFHRADLRFDRHLSGAADGIGLGHLRLATTLSFDRTRAGDSAFSQFDVRMLGIGIRGELETYVAPKVKLRAGFDLYFEHFGVVSDASNEDLTKSFPTRLDVTSGMRLDVVMKPTPRVEVVAGIRIDLYGSGRTYIPALEPRLAAKLGVSKDFALLSTIGLAQQSPGFVIPAPGLRLGSLSGGLQKALQIAPGVEWTSKLGFTVTSNAFLNVHLGLNDVLTACAYDDAKGSLPGVNSDQCDVDVRLRGKSYGLELLLKRPLTSKVGGMIAYTFSRTERTYRGDTFVSDLDRTHVLSTVASWDLGKGFRLGGRFSYVTGRPQAIPVLNAFGPAGPTIELDRRRLPDFYRLDLRFEKRWRLSATRTWTFTVEWFNALMKKEATNFQCERDLFGDPSAPGSTQRCTLQEIGPVTIPSIGVEAEL